MSSAPTLSNGPKRASLLGLPLELRWPIYRELFISAAKHDPSHWESHNPQLRYKEPWDRQIDRMLKYPPQCYDYSILCVCRQVYEEAVPILYQETRFYVANRWPKIHRNTGWDFLPERFSRLKQLRMDFSLVYEREGAIAKSIELLTNQCLLLEDLDLQLSFWCKDPRFFDQYIRLNGALATTLSRLNLRKGLILTLKDYTFIGVEILEEFRLTVAPEEKWNYCGWDHSFDLTTPCCRVKWVRSWSIGSINANLRFLEEPSEETIGQIIQVGLDHAERARVMRRRNAISGPSGPPSGRRVGNAIAFGIA